MSKAITGDLSIVTSDGTVLKSNTDLGLAWMWAAKENGPEWETMTSPERIDSVTAALGALRSAYAESEL